MYLEETPPYSPLPLPSLFDEEDHSSSLFDEEDHSLDDLDDPTLLPNFPSDEEFEAMLCSDWAPSSPSSPFSPSSSSPPSTLPSFSLENLVQGLQLSPAPTDSSPEGFSSEAPSTSGSPYSCSTDAGSPGPSTPPEAWGSGDLPEFRYLPFEDGKANTRTRLRFQIATPLAGTVAIREDLYERSNRKLVDPPSGDHSLSFTVHDLDGNIVSIGGKLSYEALCEGGSRDPLSAADFTVFLRFDRSPGAKKTIYVRFDIGDQVSIFTPPFNLYALTGRNSSPRRKASALSSPPRPSKEKQRFSLLTTTFVAAWLLSLLFSPFFMEGLKWW